MGNQNSIIPLKIQRKSAPEKMETEINIGAPTNVVRLDKDAVLKLLEEQAKQSNINNNQQQIEKISEVAKETSMTGFLNDVRQSATKYLRQPSKNDETFQSYLNKDDLVEKRVSNVSRTPSTKRQGGLEPIIKEEMEISTPTDVVHIRGLEVVKLVEEQHATCTKPCDDGHLSKLIEVAKEVPKILFKPDAFNETSVCKLIPIEKIGRAPPTPPTPPPRSPRLEPQVKKTVGIDNSLQKTSLQELESFKQTSRISKSEIKTLVKTMHETLGVILEYLEIDDKDE